MPAKSASLQHRNPFVQPEIAQFSARKKGEPERLSRPSLGWCVATLLEVDTQAELHAARLRQK